MAALDMPRRGKVNLGECRLRAVHVGRGEIVWQDRCDAANGSKEPKTTYVDRCRYFRKPSLLSQQVWQEVKMIGTGRPSCMFQ